LGFKPTNHLYHGWEQLSTEMGKILTKKMKIQGIDGGFETCHTGFVEFKTNLVGTLI
jgi:hypothetical protein